MRGVFAFVLLALVAGAGSAADPVPANSGTKPGQYLPGPFQPYNLTGPHAGKYHCLVCEFGLNPTALVFARETDAPLGKLARKLDETVGQDQNIYLRSGLIVLLPTEELENPEKRVAADTKITDWAKPLELKRVIIGTYEAAGPKGYDLEPDADVVVLLYSRLKVVKNYTFKKGMLTDKDVDAIAADFAKLSPKRK